MTTAPTEVNAETVTITVTPEQLYELLEGTLDNSPAGNRLEADDLTLAVEATYAALISTAEVLEVHGNARNHLEALARASGPMRAQLIYQYATGDTTTRHGNETERILHALRVLGYTKSQRTHLGRPGPFHSITDLGRAALRA